MKKAYEYKVAEVSDRCNPRQTGSAEVLQDMINTTARDGWRLISCHPDFSIPGQVSAVLILERSL